MQSSQIPSPKPPRKTGIHAVNSMTAIGLMAAVMGVLAPMAIPVGPIPITLATLVLYLSPYLLETRRAGTSCLVYLLMGGFGLPVFAGFSGGFGKLMGPTGGYLLGYLPLVMITGLAVNSSRRRWLHLVGMLAGTAVLYGFGTALYCFQTGSSLTAALALCVLPFLPIDGMKIALAAGMGPLLRRQLERSGLITRGSH